MSAGRAARCPLCRPARRGRSTRTLTQGARWPRSLPPGPGPWLGFLSAVLAAGCTLSFLRLRGRFRRMLRSPDYRGRSNRAGPLCSGRVSRPSPPAAGQTQDQRQQLQSLFTHGQPRPPPAPRCSPGVPASCSLCPGSKGHGPAGHWAWLLPVSRCAQQVLCLGVLAAFASASSSFHLRQHIDASCELPSEDSPESGPEAG